MNFYRLVGQKKVSRPDESQPPESALELTTAIADFSLRRSRSAMASVWLERAAIEVGV